MKRQHASESGDDLSPPALKNEPSTPPSSTSPSPKKARKFPATPSKASPAKTATKGVSGSIAHSAKGRYMEMLFEAGIKAINKKTVQGETGLSPAQQQEMLRKDKGALRRAVSAFVSGL